MYNLIRFADICIELSPIITLAKHVTTSDHVMTLPLIRTACTAVALWICIHWVSVDTPDIQKISFFLSVLQINSVTVLRLNQERLVENLSNSSLSANKPTRCSRRSSWKIKEGKGRRKENRNVSNNTNC